MNNHRDPDIAAAAPPPDAHTHETPPSGQQAALASDCGGDDASRVCESDAGVSKETAAVGASKETAASKASDGEAVDGASSASFLFADSRGTSGERSRESLADMTRHGAAAAATVVPRADTEEADVASITTTSLSRDIAQPSAARACALPGKPSAVHADADVARPAVDETRTAAPPALAPVVMATDSVDDEAEREDTFGEAPLTPLIPSKTVDGGGGLMEAAEQAGGTAAAAAAAAAAVKTTTRNAHLHKIER
ncbi:PREDICTED: uncharacterized protein LOC106805386 [Priapulus caudatus]|uniref:Uncharacterized protein LOC106805386 n=1 Tax=Priapulus caudatus TaxID=37621 RepID=A0ABM1DR63_PRICU|nr:PREDICTED: uncharacterized protein LOC106805386 [Priapulus caudatus]